MSDFPVPCTASKRTLQGSSSFRYLLAGLAACALAACGGGAAPAGGGGGAGGGGNPSPTYTIGGTVAGLPGGASVVLLDNGADLLTVSANGAFTFQTALRNGTGYAVTVGTQPAESSCTVANGSGTVASANVTSVTVTCAAVAPLTYTIGGTVSGLTNGASVTLLGNGGDSLTVAADGPFTFHTALAGGAAYSVTVGTQPAGETCVVTNGSGTVAGANVTDVAVSCSVPQASASLLYSFGAVAGTDGHYPSDLIQASDGNFYGTTQSGGIDNTGTVFTVTPTGTESIVYSFGASVVPIGYVPAALIQAQDGSFYGITNSGGTYGEGIVFRIAAGSETVLHAFGDVDSLGKIDGTNPSGLIQGTDGNLYGAADGGVHGEGVVFEVTPSGTETVLYSFGSAAGDGVLPLFGLIQASDGSLYGTTQTGGANGNGAVFEVTPAGTESILYSFGSAGSGDGQNPSGGLIEASDGNFYGMTSKGGTNGTGTVFKVTPAGSETVLYSFPAPINAIDPSPRGALIQASDGNLYGMTQHGGADTLGTVFQMTLRGTVTVIHAFTGVITDASEPVALLQGQDGNFYGAASAGAANGTGAIFKITP